MTDPRTLIETRPVLRMSDYWPAGESGVLASLLEGTADPEAGYAFEVPQVAGHQFEVVIDRGRCYLDIGIGEDLARFLEPRPDQTEDAGSRNIIGEYRDHGEDALVDHLEMTLPRPGPVGALVEFSDGDRAHELVFAWDSTQPLHVVR